MKISGRNFRCLNAFLVLILSAQLYATKIENVINYQLPDFIGEIKEINGETVIKSNGRLGLVGEPAIPWFYGTFLVPADCNKESLKITIDNVIDSIIQLNFDLKKVNGYNFKNINRKNESINIVKDIYPISDYEIIGFSNLYGNKILRLRVPLVKYDVKARKLIIRSNGNLNIKINSTKKIEINECPKSVYKRIHDIVLNLPEENSFRELNKRDNGKYVIITTNKIVQNLASLDKFVKSKESRGYTVEVVTDWGTTSTDIRSWLQDRYLSENIAYALMIGNGAPLTGDVPMHREWEQKLGDYVPTDFYYAQLSSSFSSVDCDAEIGVGRIPMYDNNYSSTDAILDRIIKYESSEINEITWRRNALLAGVYLDNMTSGSGIFEIIRKDILEPNGWSCYRIYADGIGYPDETGCTYAKFKNAWNSDSYGLVEWSAHGLKDDADNVLYTSGTVDLKSENPPIVFASSCQNGWAEVSNNLAYNVLKNAAVSIVAATRNSMYLPGQTSEIANLGSDQGYTIEIARSIVEDSLGVGDALNAVKSWATIQKSDLWVNYCGFNLYGCPELGVYSYGSSVPITEKKALENALIISVKQNKLHLNVKVKGMCTLKIFSIQGKLVKDLQMDLKTGLNVIELGKELASGSYIGRINNNDIKADFKFIKNKF